MSGENSKPRNPQLDEVTGVWKRAALPAALRAHPAMRPGKGVSAFLLRVENYAQVSREHGPAAADLILGDVAVVLKRQLRDSVLARVDQNTFLAFLPAEIAPMAGELDQLMKVLRFVQRTSIRGVIRPKLNAALRNATQARSARR